MQRNLITSGPRASRPANHGHSPRESLVSSYTVRSTKAMIRLMILTTCQFQHQVFYILCQHVFYKVIESGVKALAPGGLHSLVVRHVKK